MLTKRTFLMFFTKKTKGWYSNQSFLFKMTWNIWENFFFTKYIRQCIVFFLDHTNMPNVHLSSHEINSPPKKNISNFVYYFFWKIEEKNWKIMLLNSKNSIILFCFLQDFLNGQFVLIEVVKIIKVEQQCSISNYLFV